MPAMIDSKLLALDLFPAPPDPKMTIRITSQFSPTCSAPTNPSMRGVLYMYGYLGVHEQVSEI